MLRHLYLALASVMLLSCCSKAASLPSGIYLKSVFDGTSLRNTIYVFKNGQVAYNPTGDLEQLDFAGLKAKAPNAVGTYAVRGDELTIVWGDGTQYTGVMKPDNADGFDYRSDPYAAVRPLPPGAKLNGVYSGGASIAGAFASVSYTFDGSGGYTTNGAGVSVTSTNASAVTTGNSSSDSGTYQISGSRIHLKGSSGDREISLYYIPTNDAEPAMLLLGGVVLTRM